MRALGVSFGTAAAASLLLLVAAAPLGCNGCGEETALAPAPVTTDAGTIDAGTIDAAAPPREAAVDAELPPVDCGPTQSDPQNCGACGHACLRGACQDGACEPLPVSVLASGLASPAAIAVDETDVYWQDLGQSTSKGKTVGPNVGGDVMKCAITGCGSAPTALATGLETGFPPPSIVVDGTSVYWSDLATDGGLDARIVKCAKGGCAGVPTVVTPAWAWSLALDATTLYWATNGSSILECATGGCGSAPTALWSVPPPGELTTAIAVDDLNAYWTTSTGDVWACAKTGCGNAPSPLGSYDPAAPVAIVATGSDVFWLTSQPDALGEIMTCPKTGCPLPSILVSSLSSASSLATDGANVYWTELGDTGCCVGGAGAGRVAMCAVTGCNDHPTTLADGLDYPGAIAVDAKNVYWTTSGASVDGGAIMMIAK